MKRPILMLSWVSLTLASLPDGIHAAAVSYTNIVDTTTTAPGHGSFTNFSDPAISGTTVAFHGTYSGGKGIYTGSVGTTGAVKVVDIGNAAPGRGAFTGFGAPSVGGSNLVFVGLYSGGEGIYTGSVGATGAAKVVDASDTAPGHGAFTTFGNPSMSGSNVAFHGGYSLSDRGIYTGTAGTMGATKIADETDAAPGHGNFTGFGDTSVSGGTVAFAGSFSGGQGIYTGSVGVMGFAEVVETGDTAPGHGVFTGFGEFSVSGSNVAFIGLYSDGGGIFLASGGAGGNLSAVLNRGDTLFGSTVTQVEMGGFAYDGDAIAFRYTLANGRSGIGVATVPEPGTAAAALALAALPMLRRRPRTGPRVEAAAVRNHDVLAAR